MSKALITCHDHSPNCTFGVDPCPISNQLRPHWRVDVFKNLSTHFAGTYNLNADNTDTMDIKEAPCKSTIIGDILCDIPHDVYDIIIMPDCGGAFFTKQENSFNELFEVIPRDVYLYQFDTFTGILNSLKMGGRLIYSKILPLDDQKKRDQYVSVLNTWYQKRSVISRFLVTVEYKLAGEQHWFVLHKTPVADGGGKTRSKSKSRSKSKTRSKSKSRSKSKTRSKSKSRAKFKK